MAKKTTLSLSNLNNWLSSTKKVSSDKRYIHHRFEEKLDCRSDIISELKSVVIEAHRDARDRLQNLFTSTLDPLEEFNPYRNNILVEKYPKSLHMITLKGYFGEIFAGIIAEHFSPHGEDKWEIPAFLFRFHKTAFDQLEKIVQTGGEAGKIIGRTGDDCLAFKRNDQGEIIKSLICEAKCTATHRQKMITEAHEKSSETHLKPVNICELIEILGDYSDLNSSEWITSLQKLFFKEDINENYERYDLISYICGLPPVKKSTVIIPTNKPHSEYSATRSLQAVEIHLHDIDGLIAKIYDKQEYFKVSNDNNIELDKTWRRTLDFVKPEAFKALLMQQCKLLALNEKEAVISVSSINLYREVSRKLKNIQNAFKEAQIFQSTDKKIKLLEASQLEITLINKPSTSSLLLSNKQGNTKQSSQQMTQI